MKKLKALIMLTRAMLSIFNKAAFNEFKKISLAKRYGYYDNINELPVFNWFEISKGNYQFLHKNKKIKTYPRFFKRVHEQMLYQFDNLDNSRLRKYAELAYMKSLYEITKNVRYLNMYNTQLAEFEKEQKKSKKEHKINDITTFIEEIFESIGVIDIYKISTARYFSLYNRAIKKIEAQQKSVKNGNTRS